MRDKKSTFYIATEQLSIEFRFEGYVLMSNGDKVVFRPGPEVLSCFFLETQTGKRWRPLRCTKNLFTFPPLSPFLPHSFDSPVPHYLCDFGFFLPVCLNRFSAWLEKKATAILSGLCWSCDSTFRSVRPLLIQWEWLKGYKGRKRDKRSLSE